MNFEEALSRLKKKCRVSRAGWNGKGMYVQLQAPDDHSRMSLPYLFMRTASGEFVPWVASQTDILADDWELEHSA